MEKETRPRAPPMTVTVERPVLLSVYEMLLARLGVGAADDPEDQEVDDRVLASLLDDDFAADTGVEKEDASTSSAKPPSNTPTGYQSTSDLDAVSSTSAFSNMSVDYESDSYQRQLSKLVASKRRSRRLRVQRYRVGRLHGLKYGRTCRWTDVAPHSRQRCPSDRSWCKLRLLEAATFTMTGQSQTEHRSLLSSLQPLYPMHMRMLWQAALSLCRLCVVEEPHLVTELLTIFECVPDVEVGSRVLSVLSLLTAGGHWHQGLEMCRRKITKPQRFLRGARLFNCYQLDTMRTMARVAAATFDVEKESLLRMLASRLDISASGPLGPSMAPLKHSVHRIIDHRPLR